jgi:hypothetical protein
MGTRVCSIRGKLSVILHPSSSINLGSIDVMTRARQDVVGWSTAISAAGQVAPLHAASVHRLNSLYFPSPSYDYVYLLENVRPAITCRLFSNGRFIY